MIKQVRQVEEFHKAFGLHTSDVVAVPGDKVRQLRIKLISEESLEVRNELVGRPHPDLILKELCDLLYVTYGAIVEHGFTDIIEEAFSEVHRSNMSKLAADGSVLRREDGKVLKSELYTPANMKIILESKKDK